MMTMMNDDILPVSMDDIAYMHDVLAAHGGECVGRGVHGR